PFQAFMVHKTSPGGSASYTINGTDRKRTAQTFYNLQADQSLTITSQNIVSGLMDQTTVGFNSNATDQFDAAYDADKFGGSLNRHTLYSVNNGKWMAINMLR